MNPLAILSVIIALTVGYFGLSSSDLNFLNRGGGPIATGPGRSSEIQNPQPVSSPGFFSGFGAIQPSQPKEEARPKPGESAYKGKIRIAAVQRSGERPDQEYVAIRYGGGFFSSNSAQDKPVDITGWKIGSPRTSEIIPRAFNIPEIDAQEQDIFLPPGGETIVLSGTPTYAKNFRENQCVGYFNQSHSFTPSLSNSCPDDNPERSALLNRGFNGACIDAVNSVFSCRTPQGPFLAGVIRSDCIDYMNQNFSYVGCVKNFRDKNDFLKSTWRVFLKRNSKLFDPRHDRVILRDQNGLLVDEFEY